MHPLYLAHQMRLQDGRQLEVGRAGRGRALPVERARDCTDSGLGVAVKSDDLQPAFIDVAQHLAVVAGVEAVDQDRIDQAVAIDIVQFGQLAPPLHTGHPLRRAIADRPRGRQGRPCIYLEQVGADFARQGVAIVATVAASGQIHHVVAALVAIAEVGDHRQAHLGRLEGIAMQQEGIVDAARTGRGMRIRGRQYEEGKQGRGTEVHGKSG